MRIPAILLLLLAVGVFLALMGIPLISDVTSVGVFITFAATCLIIVTAKTERNNP